VAEEWLREAAHWTARASALAFTIALAAPVFFRQAARLRIPFFAAFAALHAVHFAVVAFFAVTHPDAGIFPGARSAAQVGGWPVVAGIVALFYVLVTIAIYARRARAGPRAQLAGRGAIWFLTFMFVATYLPLTARSWWYLLPAVLITAAAALETFEHELRCS
jgi:hypothetical protein